jgi:hypothetical protein
MRACTVRLEDSSSARAAWSCLCMASVESTSCRPLMPPPPTGRLSVDRVDTAAVGTGADPDPAEAAVALVLLQPRIAAELGRASVAPPKAEPGRADTGGPEPAPPALAVFAPDEEGGRNMRLGVTPGANSKRRGVVAEEEVTAAVARAEPGRLLGAPPLALMTGVDL